MKITNGHLAVLHGVASVCIIFFCCYSVVIQELWLFVVNALLACWTLFIFILTFHAWNVNTIKQVAKEIVREELSDPQ